MVLLKQLLKSSEVNPIPDYPSWAFFIKRLKRNLVLPEGTGKQS